MRASPSSRRAWIEIIVEELEPGADDVALLAEGVDRNVKLKRWHERQRVALFAEGVDRNMYPLAKATRPLGRPPRGGRG